MRTRYRVAVFVAWQLAAAGAAFGQSAAEHAVVEAIVRDSAQARAIRAAADVVVAEQRARFALANPALTYNREGAGFTEFYQVEQVLPAFGLRGALQRAGLAAREAADAERDARLWALGADAYEWLARLRAGEQRRRAATAVVSRVEQLIGVLRTREREGEGSRFDRLRAEQELVDQQHVAAAAAVDEAEALARVTAMLPAGQVLPEPAGAAAESGDPEPLDALISRARTARAELRALERAASRFEIESDVSRRAAGWAPAVSGGVKRADTGGDTATGALIGVGVTVPLWNRGARDADRWRAEENRARLEAAALEAVIRGEIAAAATTLSLRRRVAENSAAAVSTAGDLIAIADVAYREGDIGGLQLLDAYRTAGRARERSIAAALDVRLAQIALERAVGVRLWP